MLSCGHAASPGPELGSSLGEERLPQGAGHPVLEGWVGAPKGTEGSLALRHTGVFGEEVALAVGFEFWGRRWGSRGSGLQSVTPTNQRAPGLPPAGH